MLEEWLRESGLQMKRILRILANALIGRPEPKKGAQTETGGADGYNRQVLGMTYELQSTPNIERIVTSLCFLLKVADERRVAVTQYDLVKALFLADRSHLNMWGRPITFDNYFAMRHGPVPTTAYDLLKANARTMRRCGIRKFPWATIPIDGGKILFERGVDPNFEEVLSESDMTALKDALRTVKALSFAQVRRLTHEDPAYIDAWREDGPENSSYPMNYRLLFDDARHEDADTILEYSPYVSAG